jgi:hypothetical protein
MAANVILTGPAFDGRADIYTRELAEQIQKDVADGAMEGWQEGLDHTIRVNRGRYMSRLNQARRGMDIVLNDHGSVYGPWLEGTGSRNSPVTRFPGYHNARMVTAQIRSQVEALAQPAITRYVERMNA